MEAPGKNLHELGRLRDGTEEKEEGGTKTNDSSCEEEIVSANTESIKNVIKASTNTKVAARLWNAGVETSDIESEDERGSSRRGKKKKRRKKKNKKRKNGNGKHFNMNPFGSSTFRQDSSPGDRFAGSGTDHAPKLPSRRQIDENENNDEHPMSTTIANEAISPISPSNKKSLSRSTMKGVVKLAKQPVRLAKYTTKRVRRGIKRGSKEKRREESDNEDEVDLSDVEEESENEDFNRSPRERLKKSNSIRMNFEDSFVDCAPPALPARDASFRSASDHSSDISIEERGLSKQESRSPRDDDPRPRRDRRGITHTLGKLAKQPVKLAKQPIRLAKYTTKQVKRRAMGGGKKKKKDDASKANSVHELHPHESTAPFHFEDSLEDGEFDLSDEEHEVDIKDTDPRKKGLQKTNSMRANFEDSFVDCAPPVIPARDRSWRSTSMRSDDSIKKEVNDLAQPPSIKDIHHRRSISHTLGKLAKQPVKLARQPYRLAKYTTKKVKRSMIGKSEAKTKEPALPTRPPLADESFSLQSFDDFDDLVVDNEGRVDIEDHATKTTGYIEESPIKRTRSLHRFVGKAAKQPYRLAKYTAKQPYKLAKYTAKQPYKLVKSTGKSIRKRIKKRHGHGPSQSKDNEDYRDDDSEMDDYRDPSESSSHSHDEPVDQSREIPPVLLPPMQDDESSCNSCSDLSPSHNHGNGESMLSDALEGSAELPEGSESFQNVWAAPRVLDGIIEENPALSDADDDDSQESDVSHEVLDFDIEEESAPSPTSPKRSGSIIRMTGECAAFGVKPSNVFNRSADWGRMDLMTSFNPTRHQSNKLDGSGNITGSPSSSMSGDEGHVMIMEEESQTTNDIVHATENLLSSLQVQ